MWKDPRLAWGAIVASAALIAGGMAIAGAAQTTATGDPAVRACAKNKSGSLRILFKSTQTCRRGERAVAWNKGTPVQQQAVPLGPAGGDLAGNYPSPTIKYGSIDRFKVGQGALTGFNIAEGSLGGFNMSESLTGADILESQLDANSLSGDQILESGLGQVPKASNATTADSFTGGVGPDDVVQGSNGRMGGFSFGLTNVDQFDTVLKIDDVGRLRAKCPQREPGNTRSNTRTSRTAFSGCTSKTRGRLPRPLCSTPTRPLKRANQINPSAP